MLGPVPTAILLLSTAGWWGLAFGLLDGGWDGNLWIAALGFGAAVTVAETLAPAAPTKTLKAEWRRLSRVQRRTLNRSIARGTAAPPDIPPRIAVRVAEHAAEPTLDRGTVLRFVLLPIVVAVAAARSAPAPWLAAGSATVLVTVAAAVVRETQGRERARRAAEATRRAYSTPA